MEYNGTQKSTEIYKLLKIEETPPSIWCRYVDEKRAGGKIDKPENLSLASIGKENIPWNRVLKLWIFGYFNTHIPLNFVHNGEKATNKLTERERIIQSPSNN